MVKSWLFLGLLALAFAHENGKLTIRIDGQDQQVDIVSEDWC